jgi:hypothetical protein
MYTPTAKPPIAVNRENIMQKVRKHRSEMPNRKWLSTVKAVRCRKEDFDLRNGEVPRPAFAEIS